MLNYRKGTASDKDAILDLINYVFSFDHEPHDFKKRNPTCYDSDYPFWQDHYLAEEDGKLLATLSVTEREWNGMKIGHIGQVCVHPYHRGRGFMKVLMKMATDDMKQNGFAFAELNGLRQRYEYFGFSKGGVKYFCAVSRTNLRHKQPTCESGISLRLKNEYRRIFEILQNDQVIGEIAPYSFFLSEPKLIAQVVSLYLNETNLQETTLRFSPLDTASLAVVTEFCEGISLRQTLQYRLFRFRDTVQAALNRRSDLLDGSVVIAPESEAPFRITVKDGVCSITDEEGVQERTPHLLLQEQLFGLLPPALLPADMAKTNWFPLFF